MQNQKWKKYIIFFFLISSPYLDLIKIQSIYEVLKYRFSIDNLQCVTDFYVVWLFINVNPFSLENSSLDVQLLKLTIQSAQF